MATIITMSIMMSTRTIRISGKWDDGDESDEDSDNFFEDRKNRRHPQN